MCWAIDGDDERSCYIFFFFNDTATTEIYTLSLHDALPIFFCSNQSFETLIFRFSILELDYPEIFSLIQNG